MNIDFTELRLNIRNFFRKNKRVILIIVLIWAIIFGINTYLRLMPKPEQVEVSLEEHKAVVNDNETPASVANLIEQTIDKYVNYNNQGNFEAAFNMLSEECRHYSYKDDVLLYMEYMYTKMPMPRNYTIQSYSTTTVDKETVYIYEVRYFEDMLATGLSDQDYSFTSEKLAFYYDDNGQLQMSNGSYIYQEDIKSMTENEYLKVDVVDKIVSYSTEVYKVKFTNRSNYTIVICDYEEEQEVMLVLPQEMRGKSETEHLVLDPGQTREATFTFQKFVDDNDESQSILFNSVRVMEKYSGTGEEVPEEVRKSEIDNAISKFSMTVTAHD